MACPPCPHISSRCLYRCIFPWPFLCLSQSIWTHVTNPHDSVSGHIHPLHACMNWTSHPFGAYVHTPPAERHSYGITPCPASPGTWSPSPLWLMDNSSALGDSAKNRPLSCIDVCTNDVSQVIKQKSHRGLMGHVYVPLSLLVYELYQYDLVGHIHHRSLLLLNAKPKPCAQASTFTHVLVYDDCYCF